jgi:alcohol dehydrogenase
MRVLFGPGKLTELGAIVRDLGGQRILLVTDPGIVAAGHVEPALESIAAAGLSATVFDGVAENPTTRHVERCMAVARSARADLLIGLGGGSAMDTAKGANFLLTNGGKMEDYWGVGKATKPMLPFVAIPTTAGTGSEAQSFALIAKDETHEKMACGDKKAAARVAILDPALTVSQPAWVTATAGIDAISHAIESYVTKARTPMSSMFARESWQLLASAYPAVLEDPTDIDARGRMLFGAHLAGCAIECSMLGATHSAANPLTAHFGTIHGAAIGILLPAVIRFNSPVASELYAELVGGAVETAGERLAQTIEGFRILAGLPQSLAEQEVDPSQITRLAHEAAQQWTAQFNPRPPSVQDFESIYRTAFAA